LPECERRDTSHAKVPPWKQERELTLALPPDESPGVAAPNGLIGHAHHVTQEPVLVLLVLGRIQKSEHVRT
jgi:hypothetical protein